MFQTPSANRDTLAPPPVRRNQFGDFDDEKMTIEKWIDRWSKGQTKFHMPVVHPMLQKHFLSMTGERDELRIFLPLCGKSRDMDWLSEKGHNVVGCEAVELACHQFYEENDIPYSVTSLNVISGKMFKSTSPEKQVTLYCCDFFDLTDEILGHIDCIWDRGSLAALDVEDRVRYVRVLTALMDENTSYMLDHFLVDNTIFAGPPYNLDHDSVKTFFGTGFEMELLEERDAMSDWQRSWGLTSFTEIVHLLRKA